MFFSLSALINRHTSDKTPENVVWCLGGTLLPSDTISTTWHLSCVSLVGGCLQLFSRQDKLVERRAFFPLSEGRLVVTASLWVDAPLLYPS